MKKIIVVLLLFISICMGQTLENTSQQESLNIYTPFTPLDKTSNLYKIGYNIIYKWHCNENGECRQPSFKCDDDEAKYNDIEREICSKTDEYFRGFTSIILYDNFFNSYYYAIIQHISKNKKQEVKRIVKQSMKQRDSIDIQQCANSSLSGTATLECIDSQIIRTYYQGLSALSQYLLANNKELFIKIFKNSKRYEILLTQSYVDISDVWDYRLFGSLYLDHLIDSSGKLIVKVDSQ